MTCPHCAETIPSGGGWCPFCRSDVPVTTGRMLPVDNTFAWALVLLPVAVLLLAVVVAASVPNLNPLVLTVVFLAVNWWFVVEDEKRVRAAGYEGAGTFLGIVFIPIYLVRRSMQTGNWAITLLWCLTFLGYLAIASSGS